MCIRDRTSDDMHGQDHGMQQVHENLCEIKSGGGTQLRNQERVACVLRNAIIAAAAKKRQTDARWRRPGSLQRILHLSARIALEIELAIQLNVTFGSFDNYQHEGLKSVDNRAPIIN